MATKALIPLDEYLRTSYEDLDREYVDGEVIERPMPPFEHGLLQGILAELFRRHRRTHRLWVVCEVRQRTTEARVRIPDVAVYRGARPVKRVPEEAPYVALEILSPDDRAKWLMEKFREYRALGVAHSFLVDPYSRTVSEYGSDGLREATAMRLPELGIEFTNEEIFGELDEVPVSE